MDYAIGDIQGCYTQLQQLLDAIHFNPQIDTLWLAGDLVNRGPDSLSVLRFISQLPSTKIVLGNHDLHMLAVHSGALAYHPKKDTFIDVLTAQDCNSLCHWLQQQPLLQHCPELNVVMTHAGMPPCFDLPQAKALSDEFRAVLCSDRAGDFFKTMYGNQPAKWSDQLVGEPRLRLITNYFTRMRYLSNDGSLELQTKHIEKSLCAWFDFKPRKAIAEEIVFGHWASLEGKVSEPSIHALDTGCVWGGQLTAMCLQTKKRTSVPGYQANKDRFYGEE